MASPVRPLSAALRRWRTAYRYRSGVALPVVRYAHTQDADAAALFGPARAVARATMSGFRGVFASTTAYVPPQRPSLRLPTFHRHRDGDHRHELDVNSPHCSNAEPVTYTRARLGLDTQSIHCAIARMSAASSFGHGRSGVTGTFVYRRPLAAAPASQAKSSRTDRLDGSARRFLRAQNTTLVGGTATKAASSQMTLAFPPLNDEPRHHFRARRIRRAFATTSYDPRHRDRQYPSNTRTRYFTSRNGRTHNNHALRFPG